MVRKLHWIPSLYNIVSKKHVSDIQAFNSRLLNLTFYRALISDKLAKWNELAMEVAFVKLNG